MDEHFKASAVPPRDLKCPICGSNGLDFVACCFSANCECDSHANVPRNIMGGEQWLNRRKCEGMYRFCPLFGRENCMSVYAAKFSGCRQAVYRSVDKNCERFCVAPQPPAVSHPSPTRSPSPWGRPHRRVGITYA